MPSSGILSLVPPAGEIFASIDVKEGDRIQQHRIIAQFESYEIRKIELKLAEVDLKKIKSDYAQDIQIRQTKIRGLQRQLAFLEKQINRYRESDVLSYTTPEIVERREKEVIQLENEIALTRAEMEKIETLFPSIKQKSRGDGSNRRNCNG